MHSVAHSFFDSVAFAGHHLEPLVRQLRFDYLYARVQSNASSRYQLEISVFNLRNPNGMTQLIRPDLGWSLYSKRAAVAGPSVFRHGLSS